ncbi:NADH-quinone oxidoreductase subunit B family protein [Thermococcus sp.]
MWIIRGLKKGVLTSEYPKSVSEEELPFSFPLTVPENCPFGAVENREINYRRCINCRLCRAEFGPKAGLSEVNEPLNFKRSIHVFFLDVGTCHACNREINLLHSPIYDVHRLGIFFTPTPKHADVLLVAGCPTDGMIPVLREAYELMPEPKRVLVIGSENSALCDRRVEDFIPVHGRVPGCPPSPVQILEGLLKVAGRDVE